MPDSLERYDFVLRWLHRQHAHLAASVMRLGRLRMTEKVSSAAILAQGTHVWFYFNPQFFDQLKNAELAGVLTHEALHFVLQHQERVAAISAQRDRYYFTLACEAVINDLIVASFPEMKLPGQPVTGQWLVGRNTSHLSAEQVMQLLAHHRSKQGAALDLRLATAQPIDDHSVWEVEDDDCGSIPCNPPSTAASSSPVTAVQDEGSGHVICDALATDAMSLPVTGDWTAETTDMVKSLLAEIPSNDPTYGTIASGIRRPAPPASRCSKSLAQFLADMVSIEACYDTLWTVPNRKLLAFYPQVILPTYEPRQRWDILMAIDASGSVPIHFLSVAVAFARQPHPRTRITMISFDTAWYEADAAEGTLRGAGGTRVQAVEEFIQQRMACYPDIVFLLTDGFTPPPAPEHPERWIWLLPPWGSTQPMPEASAAQFFEVEEMLCRHNPAVLRGNRSS